jgi:hypothetical protein
MQHLKPKKDLDEDLLRHMCINTIRANVKQFRKKYNNIIICCDNRHYWRKDFFPFYKSHRKDDREASGYNWPLIFDILNRIKQDLKDYFPYKVIDVEKAEADDIIAVLTEQFSKETPVLILSGDKDFVQLQRYSNVEQYNPIMKRFVKVDDPLRYVKEHIIRGDRGDGVPNILSPDNTFVIGERQKRINTKKLEEWIKQDATGFCNTDDMLRNYYRNQTLVDFTFIPESIKDNIIQTFETVETGSKQKMLDYFIGHGMKVMIESIADF